MSNLVILDTGVLVAFLLSQDRFHSWAVDQLSQVQGPAITCEAVIAESCFLTQRVHQGPDKVLELVKRCYLTVPFCLDTEIEAVQDLMSRYRSVPMSLADACLVRMSELFDGSCILTLDSDFQIYRKHRNQVIPVIMPD